MATSRGRKVSYLIIAIALTPIVVYVGILISYQVKLDRDEERALEKAQRDVNNMARKISKTSTYSDLQHVANPSDIQIIEVRRKPHETRIIGIATGSGPGIMGNVAYDFCFEFRAYGDNRGDADYKQVDHERCGLPE